MAVTHSTYAGLKAEVADLYPRADIGSGVDNYIARAEAEFNRVLRLPQMITTNPALAASARFTTLPTGFLEMQRVQLNQGGRRTRLDFIGEEYAPKITDGRTGTPRWWNVIGTQLELLPAPGASVSLDISYWAEVTTIIDGPANFLLTSHPDLYLYRTLLEAAIARGDDKRVTRYTPLYTNALTAVQRLGKRARYGRAMAVRAA